MVGVMEEEEDDTNPLYHGYQQSLARVHQEFRGKHLHATSNVFNLSVVRIPSGPPARNIPNHHGILPACAREAGPGLG